MHIEICYVGFSSGNLCRVCLSKGIPFREVAPLWSEREFWAEAFITSKPLLLSFISAMQFVNYSSNKISLLWRSVNLRPVDTCCGDLGPIPKGFDQQAI